MEEVDLKECNGCRSKRACFMRSPQSGLFTQEVIDGLTDGTIENDECDIFKAIDNEIREYLQELVNQLSTRNAGLALGWTVNSYSSLKSLCYDYDVTIPSRSNQHSSIDENGDVVDQPDEFNEEMEILADGGYRSTKLIKMSEEEMKNPTFLMKAHGFDPAEWDLVTAKNNMWNVFSKDAVGDHNISTLYSSKITVKPLKSRFDIDEIVGKLQTVERVVIEKPESLTGAHGMLEIPLFDMHFGPSTFEHYKPTLASIVSVIMEHNWKQIIIPVGQDLLHNDNLRGQTAKGTIIEKIDLARSWHDAAMFYSTIIEYAIQYSDEVYVLFSIGNHDESMSWAFCQGLAWKYPQVNFNLEIEERKVHAFGDVCIGFTHGEKSVKDFDRVFMTEFPQFALAKVREIHTAHKHHEITKDMFGIVMRTLPTGAMTDDWHKAQGYVGVNKRFQLFEYTTEALASIRYV